MSELSCILKALKKGKACGDDDIPGEFWKICLLSDKLLNWLLKFCNIIWQSRTIPQAWHRAKVACLFKKGDPALPENYRPISLLQIGKKKGTQDAIFIAKRMIEKCFNEKNRSVILLALDWAKAFDCIDPAALVEALRRYGLPK
eukprot:12420075-Karenia_brevis.AAC.1